VTVAVSIGADGSVCGVNAVSDTLNNPAITSCVISKFRSGSFPKPQQGCVVVQVPISFKSRR
jgi:ethanolamine ammonia-lyase large subunit